jgi:hypothetical protein
MPLKSIFYNSIVHKIMLGLLKSQELLQKILGFQKEYYAKEASKVRGVSIFHKK